MTAHPPASRDSAARLLIEVTQADIDAGKPGTVCYSPLGIALERTLGDGRHYDVWGDGVVNTLGRRMRLSTRALRAYKRFHRGKPIKPFRWLAALSGPADPTEEER